MTVKKCTKKRDARAELLFCLFNQLLFWRSRCRRRRGILKSLLSRVQHNIKFPCSTREFTTLGFPLKSTKVPFIWKKHVPGRRITHFSELPWASQLLLHYLTDNWRPFIDEKQKVSGSARRVTRQTAGTLFDGRVTLLPSQNFYT